MEEDFAVEEGADVPVDLVQEVVASYAAPEVDDGIVLIPASADERDRAAVSPSVVPLVELASSREDASISAAAASEDAEFLQTVLTTEEREASCEAEKREQETLELDEEEDDEEEREAEVEGGELDSQEGTASASEADWELDEERTATDELAEAQDVQLPEVVSTELQQVEREGEGEDGEEEEGGVVTQRDEEIENYQSTVKELTAVVIDREEKIGVHQLELHAYIILCTLHTINVHVPV